MYIIPSHHEDIELLVSTSPFIRDIIVSPEITGSYFQRMFSKGLEESFENLRNSETTISGQMKVSPLDVLYILRGGLNFDLHHHFSEDHKFPEVSFCSSQRVMTDSTFQVEETSYAKWSLQDKAILCIGDICATGTTIRSMVNNAVQQYLKEGKSPAGLLLVTIGTDHTINLAVALLKELRQHFGKSFQGITILFLEGIFQLKEQAISYNDLNLSYTDFFVNNRPRAIEFELERLRTPSSFLERCVIYDGGSRAFEPAVYKANLIRYWTKLLQLSNTMDMETFLTDRTDMMYYNDFDLWQKKHTILRDTDADDRRLFEQGAATLAALRSAGIEKLCEQRLETLQREILPVL